MARVSSPYIQTVLGECGHVCTAWPLIHVWHTGRDEVICEECTREALRLDPADEISIWVRTVQPKPEAKKVSAPKKPRVKTVTCSLCQKKGHGFMECPLISEPML